MRREQDIQCSSPLEIEKALSELFPVKVIDEGAKTIEEIASAVGMGRSQTERRMKDAVDAGTWEQVFKHADSGRLSKAFRPVKQ